MIQQFDVIITKYQSEKDHKHYHMIYVDCKTTDDHVFAFGFDDRMQEMFNGTLEAMTTEYEKMEVGLRKDGWVEFESKVMSFSAESEDMLSKASCFDGMMNFIKLVFEHNEAIKIVNRVIRLSDKIQVKQPQSELYTNWGAWA